jgi:hypothetical protein
MISGKKDTTDEEFEESLRLKYNLIISKTSPLKLKKLI